MAVGVDPWPPAPEPAAPVVPQIGFGDGFWTAVVDRAGVIRAVNEARRCLGRENGGAEVGAGVDYLAVCDAAGRVGDASAAEAARLIRDVIADREVHGQQDYACDSPSVQRRFVMLVWPHVVDGGLWGP